jgi:hypothetical protein
MPDANLLRTALPLLLGSLGSLAACAAPAPERQVEAPTPVVTFPFELVRNQIVVPVTIGGQGPFHMLLDTAVDPSGIDLETALGAGVAIDTTVSGQAVGTGSGQTIIYPGEIAGLEIAGHSFEPFPTVASTIFGALGERLGRPLHGILGVSFLGSRTVRIDYPARRVSLYDEPWPNEPEPGGVALPLSRDGNDVVVDPFHVNGRPFRMSLDTGSSLTLELYSPTVTELGLDSLRAGAEAGTVMGARGEAAILTARVDSIGIGPLQVHDAEVTFPERDGSTDGNLGNGYLSEFVLTVDYLGGRLLLEPASASGAAISGS